MHAGVFAHIVDFDHWTNACSGLWLQYLLTGGEGREEIGLGVVRGGESFSEVLFVVSIKEA